MNATTTAECGRNIRIREIVDLFNSERQQRAVVSRELDRLKSIRSELKAIIITSSTRRCVPWGNGWAKAKSTLRNKL